MTEPAPELATVVVSWRSREDVAALLESFPDDPRHELLVVDNADELEGLAPARRGVRIVRPGANLGFAGGSNRGAAESSAPRLLFLNPDARPLGEALDRVVEGFDRLSDVAGLAPRLVDAEGGSQHRWQLRPLPGAASLLAHAFFWSPTRGPRVAPPAGAAIGQPAAAALALRRGPFEAVGGFDARFHPAWFEDVDLARRLAAGGHRIAYWPEATFEHRGGGSVRTLGYGRFLEAYDRNLELYLRTHHGRAWALAFRAAVPLGAAARLLALPLRRPRRAATRSEAARALLGAARSALAGWPAERAV